MMESLEETPRAQQVLFETRTHATRPFSSSSFQQQVQKGAKGVFPSVIAGLNQIKEKWHSYRRPKFLRKPVSLFVSPQGDFVAVAVGNEITFLSKEDNYAEPRGIFTSDDSFATFVDGVWLEACGVLGVLDSLGSLYLIRLNGEKTTRVTTKQLKISSPVIGLISSKDSSFFHILSGDGLFWRVMGNQDLRVPTFSEPILSDHLAQKMQFPQNISCLNFHPDLSLLILVVCVSDGLFCLSLWHVTADYSLQFLTCSSQFEGLFHPLKDSVVPQTMPKVLISSQGDRVAAIDMTGRLYLFNLDGGLESLTVAAISDKLYSFMGGNLGQGNEKCLSDVVDFTWWSDTSIIFSKKDRTITILDFQNETRLVQTITSPVLVLERVQQYEGSVFALAHESSSDERKITTEHMCRPAKNGQGVLLDTNSFKWCLISFSERSVSEMYSILISKQQFADALDFAYRYGLDTDEIFKSQWLLSDLGSNSISSFLSNIKDQNFVLTECINKVGPTEDAVRTLILHGLNMTDQYKFSVVDYNNGHSYEFWNVRLQLLQCRDRLETFLGINMGRFSVPEYSKFRVLPLKDSAILLAENGKIGALNLLFKRHSYSLSPFILEILSAIPETIPTQTYNQLLPGRLPPSTIALRDADWVESEKIISFFDKILEGGSRIDIRTEVILKQLVGFVWPSIAELSLWYKNRVRDIDIMSGQIDNCLSLVELACQKGISELQQFGEDLMCFSQLIYSDVFSDEAGFSMGFATWEQLSDYEKFKLMLKGVKGDTVVARLKEKAVPFMQKRSTIGCLEQSESCLVRWLKEIASENNLDICLMVIEEGCRDVGANGFFKDEVEAVDVALHCVYSCALTDQWNIMAEILSKLMVWSTSFPDANFSPRLQMRAFRSFRFAEENNRISSSNISPDLEFCNKSTSFLGDSSGYMDLTSMDKSVESLEKSVKLAEGHVEAGRLLSFYQVPKPISFFLKAHLDEKGVKQLLRLILSKFGRRHPGRSDSDWANMWRDMQSLREKAFPFLDLEYMLMEFCRGLLKAGKFTLAKNYLKGTGSLSLALEKAENLVIQAAREYFFSASTLSCTEIWKAKECLNLFPNSTNVKAEADIIDALTVRLPSLGVTLLPMQFRQIRDPMEIIHMVIKNQSGVYFDVDELIDIAKLLGLSSQDDIAMIQEAVAREAAVTGDLQVAFDTCLELVKKGHGPIWDLCAAMARGPSLDNVDTSSRKKLLGFALSHCDDESVADLLHAWKDLDIHAQCEKLTKLYGTSPQNFHITFEQVVDDSQECQLQNIVKLLSTVARDPSTIGTIWDAILHEKGKFLNFAALELPWLLELSRKDDGYEETVLGSKVSKEQNFSLRVQAMICIVSWLAMNSIAPKDDLIAYLAKLIMGPPFTDEGDSLGCLILLNLFDAFHGVEVVEKQLASRKQYQEICSIMDIGMTFSILNNAGLACCSSGEKRSLLLERFQARPMSLSSGEMENVDKVQPTFWREWKCKLEEQKQLADQARSLEQIMPRVDSARFLSGDSVYIKSTIFSYIDSAKGEKKPIMKEALALASSYGLDRSEVLLHCVASILVSDQWAIDDIVAEVSCYKAELLDCSEKVINMISLTIYPLIDGHNKLHLAFLYGLLADCYIWMEKRGVSSIPIFHDQPSHTLKISQFCKLLEHECRRLSFIGKFNFKNVAGLSNLNFTHFNQEVYNNISEFTVEALAKMVETLVSIYDESKVNGLISGQHVYKHHVQSSLENLESGRNLSCLTVDELPDFLSELKQNYDYCRVYIQALPALDVLGSIEKYYELSFSPIKALPHDSSLLECFMLVLNFWIQLTEDIQETLSHKTNEKIQIEFDSKAFLKCLELFKKLLSDCTISVHEGCLSVSDYLEHWFMKPGLSNVISNFSQSMIFSGCGLKAVAAVYLEALQYSSSLTIETDWAQNLSTLYVSLVELVLLSSVDMSSAAKCLTNLISSLCKLEGNLEVLDRVRRAVWERLIEFSDNMQLARQTRVYSLELLQSICGRKQTGAPDELCCDVQSWEGWNGSYFPDAGNLREDGLQQPDTSSRLIHTLAALKSTQLVAAVSASLEVTPDDLMNLDSAVSCFLRLSSSASSDRHFEILVTILEEWEVLFSGIQEGEGSVKIDEHENNWDTDDWGGGWESFPEDQTESLEKKDDLPISVHPLHACWAEVIRKLVNCSKFPEIIKIIDKMLLKSKGILLTEDEAWSLNQLVSESDCFMALKVMLPLPYKNIWFKCLDAVEAHLKREGNSEMARVDHELLVLILSSRSLSTLSENTGYGCTFSYICRSVGYLSRLVQEHQLFLQKNGEKSSMLNERDYLLFTKITFPCFVSELVSAKQFLLAGFIILQCTCPHPPISLINIAEASIRRYLEEQILCMQRNDEDNLESLYCCGCLVNSVFCLKDNLAALLREALSTLSDVT